MQIVLHCVATGTYGVGISTLGMTRSMWAEGSDLGEVTIQTITCNAPLAEAAGVVWNKISTGLANFQWKARDGNDSEYAAICTTDTTNTVKQLKKMIGDNPLVDLEVTEE